MDGSTASRNECISSRLRLAREQAGLSQGQVAKIMQLHRPAITEIEAGRRKVSAEELVEFAHVYGVGVEWLACAEVNEHDPNKDLVELAARGLAKLQPEDLQSLLDLISTLKNRT